MIQTVKLSPLVDIKYNQGFYDALCALNLFFCKRKFFSLAAPFCQLSSEASRSKGLQRVSKVFQMGFQCVLKGFPRSSKAFQKGFQSVSKRVSKVRVLKGFPKGFQRVSKRFTRFSKVF